MELRLLSVPVKKILLPAGFTCEKIVAPESFHSAPLTIAVIFAGQDWQLLPPQSISRSPLFRIPSEQFSTSEMAVSTLSHPETNENAKIKVNAIQLIPFTGIS